VGPSELAGVLAVKIDWKASGVDLIGQQDAVKLRSGWVVRYGQSAVPLTLSEADALGLLTLITPASAGAKMRDDAVGRPEDRAALTAKLSSEPDATGVNQITLSVTNQGPDAAYKVTAQLRSSSTAIHGTRLSLGVIKNGETKSQVTPVSITGQGADLNPTASDPYPLIERVP
jgi:hypothetical protein